MSRDRSRWRPTPLSVFSCKFRIMIVMFSVASHANYPRNSTRDPRKICSEGSIFYVRLLEILLCPPKVRISKKGSLKVNSDWWDG